MPVDEAPQYTGGVGITLADRVRGIQIDMAFREIEPISLRKKASLSGAQENEARDEQGASKECQWLRDSLVAHEWSSNQFEASDRKGTHNTNVDLRAELSHARPVMSIAKAEY